MKRAILLTTASISAAIAAALATIALVLVASGSNPALAFTSLVNGNFETGNLSGWTADTTSFGGAASAVASYDYYYQVGCTAETQYGGPCYDGQTMLPKEGSYFALLKAGKPLEYTKLISQPFKASNGGKVSGWAFFDTDMNLPSCTGATDDKGQVVVKSASGTTVATPFEESVSRVGYDGNSGWKYWEHTFTNLTGESDFQIEARVGNTTLYEMSRMGLDDVKTSTGGGPDTTLPETYIKSGYGTFTAGEACITDSTSNTFEFSSNEQGSTFKCQLSKDWEVVQAWADCTSPKSYSNLSRAESYEALYKFEVQATDPAGNVDPTPENRYWFIKRGTNTQPPTDSTAPAVMSTVPEANATGVAPTTNVTATFDEELDSSTLTTSNFTLVKDGTTESIPASVSYDAATKKATLDPTQDLDPATKYTATVKTGVKDKVGNPLASDYTWSFTTQATQTVAAPSGLTATRSGSLRNQYIQLAWTDNSTTTNEDNFVVERSTDGETFTTLTTLAKDTTSYNDTYQLKRGTTYTYRVKATKGSDSSAYSNTVSVTTK